MEVGKPFKVFSKAQTNYLGWCESNCSLLNFVVSLVALVVKKPACRCRRLKRCGFNPCWEDPLEKEMATHSSILA